jgi:hypothetical protein
MDSPIKAGFFTKKMSRQNTTAVIDGFIGMSMGDKASFVDDA